MVNQSKALHPNDPIVQKAIPVSTGRRLDVVRMFTKNAKSPDLTSLVVNKVKGECGDGFTRSFNPEKVRDKFQRHNWSKVKAQFLLRSYNGLVFTSCSYSAMYKSYGLRQKLFITTHCRIQKGMIERMNRTIKGQFVNRYRFETMQHESRVVGD